MRRLKHAVCGAALIVMIPGCSPYLQATAGYTSALAEPAPGHRGGALNLHAGVNVIEGKTTDDPASERGASLAFGVNLRARFNEHVQQLAFGHEAMFRYVLHRGATSWSAPCSPRRSAEFERDLGASAQGACLDWHHPILTPMEIYVRTGVSLITGGAKEGSPAAGLTRFWEYGLVLMRGAEDVPYWTLGFSLDQDVRFDGDHGPFTITFLLGAGFLKTRRAAPGGGGLFLGN